MEQEKVMDVASEPVDLNNDASFMDTGVLHQGRMCVKCGDKAPIKGATTCKECAK